MDIVTQTKALDLMYKMFVLGKPGFAPAKYTPQKTRIQDSPVPRSLVRSSPEKHGVDSSYIDRFYYELEENEEIMPHTVMILADGEVISEAAVKPFDIGTWNCAYSFSKTVTGMAIGLLISEGKLALTDRVTDILKSDAPPVLGARMKSITVKNLLEMSSGVLFNEVGVVTDENWTRAFMESSVKFEPGSEFAYNSMNSYMLSAIVHEVSGEGLLDYLRPRVFAPMGIESVMWECCPKGIEMGGMGLFICPEDMAKLGVMMLCEGEWNGNRILPADWVREMTTSHMTPPDSAGNFDYGYQMWVNRRDDSFLFNGMFGQNVYVRPKNNMVIVTTCGNSEVFQNSDMMRTVEKYFGGSYTRSAPSRPSSRELTALRRHESSFFDCRAWTRPQNRSVGNAFWHLFSSKPDELPRECYRLIGEDYIFDTNNVGFVPLVIRMIDNNHSPGLTKMRFDAEDGRFFITLTEGEAVYRMEIGFGKHIFTDICMNGEKFRVGVSGEFTINEDYRRLFKVEFAFTEMPNTRRLKILFGKNKLITRWSEMPGQEMVEEFVDSMDVNMPTSASIATFIRPKLDSALLSYKITEAFSPTVIARPEDALTQPPAKIASKSRALGKEKEKKQKRKSGNSSEKEQ